MPAAALNAKERLWRTKVELGKTPGSAQPAHGGYLFSHKALGKVFAAKVRAALAEVGLTLPAGLGEPRPPVMAEKDWKALFPRTRALVEDLCARALCGALQDEDIAWLHDSMQRTSNK